LQDQIGRVRGTEPSIWISFVLSMLLLGVVMRKG
jgi:hypothetical protein